MKSLAEQLSDLIAEKSESLQNHPIFSSLENENDLHIFLEHMIFSTWDYMSLLKSAQQQMTCVTVPWLPEKFKYARRLINELVLIEESDFFHDSYSSKFELLYTIMIEINASTKSINRFVECIDKMVPVDFSLRESKVPLHSANLVKTTMDIIENASIHQLIIALLIRKHMNYPQKLKENISKFPAENYKVLSYYLEQEANKDFSYYQSIFEKAIMEINGNDENLWQQSIDMAKIQFTAFEKFLSGIKTQLRAEEIKTA